MAYGPHHECIEWLLLPLLWVGEHLATLPSLHGVEGSYYPGSAQPYDMDIFKSVVGIKPGDSGVVIGYQVGEFTHTCSAEYLIAWSHVYPGFTDKVSILIHFLFKPDCEDYSFWNRQLNALSIVLILSLWAPLIHQNWMHPLIRLMQCLLHSLQGIYAWLVIFLIILDCSFLLASNLVNYGAMVGLCFCLYHRQVKCKLLSWFINLLIIQLHWFLGFFATW